VARTVPFTPWWNRQKSSSIRLVVQLVEGCDEFLILRCQLIEQLGLGRVADRGRLFCKSSELIKINALWQCLRCSGWKPWNLFPAGNRNARALLGADSRLNSLTRRFAPPRPNPIPFPEVIRRAAPNQYRESLDRRPRNAPAAYNEHPPEELRE
jgi:hypothetical protein